MSRIVKIRASSWASLFDCPLRWAAVVLDGKYLPSAPPAHLGTAIHAGSAAFDQARIDGSPITIDEASGAVVDALRHPEYEVDWSREQRLTKKTAERIGISLLTRYCAEIAPTQRYVAVEMACEPVQIDMGGDLTIELTGTLDRLREVSHWIEIEPGDSREVTALGISDLKSGGCRINADGEVNVHSDGPQLAQYEILAEANTGRKVQADAEIIAMKTNGGGEVRSQTLKDCRSILVGTRTIKGMLSFAADMLRSGSFHPNPKSTLCSSAYCVRFAQCPYHR